MKLKEWWPLLVGLGIYIAILAFVAGLAVATKPSPDAPFGLVEMWINRYQTLIAAGLAFTTLFLGLLQVGATRAANRQQALLSVRNELDAIETAIELAQAVRDRLSNGVMPTRLTSPMLDHVKRYASPRLSGAFDQLARGVLGYIDQAELRSTFQPALVRSTEMIIDIGTHEREVLNNILAISE